MAVTEVIAPVTGNVVHKYTADSTAVAIAESTDAVDQAMRFDSLTLHLSAGPTTSEAFTVTLNSRNGAAWDTLLFTLDLSVAPVVDLALDETDIDIILYRGDALDIAWTNTDLRTHGLEFSLVEAA